MVKVAGVDPRRVGGALDGTGEGQERGTGDLQTSF